MVSELGFLGTLTKSRDHENPKGPWDSSKGYIVGNRNWIDAPSNLV